jgi:error-prone DNA polymerase
MTFELQPPLIEPSGLPDITASEQVRSEIDILGMDISSHLLEFYGDFLNKIGAVRSSDLIKHRSGTSVLVAGVKVATQTPPIRTGRRVVFVTVDDSTGPIDAAFFEEAQNQYASTIFNSWLVLMRGNVRRTGPRGVSISADGCWELSAVYRVWLDGGLPAVAQMLLTSPYDDSEAVIPAQIWEHASGFRQSPYADVRT